MLLHLMTTSPNGPANSPLTYSLASESCIFMYESVDTNVPLYSCPHFNLIDTGFDTRSRRKGFGLTVEIYQLFQDLKTYA